MVSGWESIHLDELEAIPLFAGLRWKPVRRRLGIEAFGINAYESEAPGELVVEEHDESGGGAGGHEEVYIVVRGRATFTVDGSTIDAPSGTLVFIRDPTLRRSAIAQEEDTLVLAVGAERGRAFEVSPWEPSFAAIPDLRAGRWQAAIAMIEEGLRVHPGHPSLLYNLACAEAGAGMNDEAMAHLLAAIAGNPSYRDDAIADPDFEALRGHPDFPAAE